MYLTFLLEKPVDANDDDVEELYAASDVDLRNHNEFLEAFNSVPSIRGVSRSLTRLQERLDSSTHELGIILKERSITKRHMARLRDLHQKMVDEVAARDGLQGVADGDDGGDGGDEDDGDVGVHDELDVYL